MSTTQTDSVTDDKPLVSTGRGGAGNIRAASRTRGPEETSEGELEAREKSRERSRERGHAAGRGGAGNFRSASRDPAARIREEEEGQQMARAEVNDPIRVLVKQTLLTLSNVTDCRLPLRPPAKPQMQTISNRTVEVERE